jgi:hypothetical protein
MYAALVMDAETAEKSVVEAFVIVAVPVVLVFTNDAPFAERLVVDAESVVEVATEREAMVEVEVKVVPNVDDAEESAVVEAFSAVKVVLVRVAMKPFVKVRPVPDTPVVEALPSSV